MHGGSQLLVPGLCWLDCEFLLGMNSYPEDFRFWQNASTIQASHYDSLKAPMSCGIAQEWGYGSRSVLEARAGYSVPPQSADLDSPGLSATVGRFAGD